MVSDPETRKPCKRQVFLFEQLMIFSEPFERKLDWTVYIYRHSIKVMRQCTEKYNFLQPFKNSPHMRHASYIMIDSVNDAHSSVAK